MTAADGYTNVLQVLAHLHGHPRQPSRCSACAKAAADAVDAALQAAARAGEGST